MNEPFTTFVRQVDSEEGVAAAALNEVWTLLRRWTRRYLQRRDLWYRPPGYLGVLGYSSWTEPGQPEARGVPKGETRDALDELVSEIYVDLFVQRLPTLERYVRSGRTIEAVVRRGIVQALHGRQRSQDPLGHRLYQWLRSALQAAIVGGARVIAGSESIDGSTVLRLDSESDAAPPVDRALEERLADAVAHWNDEMFIDWLTASGDEANVLVERLRAGIEDLPRRCGLAVLAVQPLVVALRHDARRRLELAFAGWSGGRGGFGNRDVLDLRIEAECFDRLHECVEDRLDGLPAQQRTRDQLRRLWRLLGLWARYGVDGVDAGPSTIDRRLDEVLDRDELPSRRQLGRLLGLRHDRVSDLLARLKAVVGPCLDESSPGTDSLHDEVSPSERTAPVDKTGDLESQLLAMTARAHDAGQDALGQRVVDGEGPLPGSIYQLGDGRHATLDWLLLAERDGWCYLLPADSEAWLGSMDVAVTAASGIERFRIRAGRALAVPASALTQAPSGRVADERLDAVRHFHVSVLTGHHPSRPRQLGVDLDADYRAWRRLIEAEMVALAEASGGRLEPPLLELVGPHAKKPAEGESRVSTSSPRQNRGLALAASIALAVGLGLVAGRVWEQMRSVPRITELEVEKTRAEQENEALIGELESQRREHAREVESSRRQADAALEEVQQTWQERLEAAETAWRSRLAEAIRPETQPAFSFIPRGRQRGLETLTLRPDTRSALFEIDGVRPGDTVEIEERPSGRLVWRETVEEVTDVLFRVLIPVDRLSPGEIRVQVLREDEVVTTKRLRIVDSQLQGTGSWPE